MPQQEQPDPEMAIFLSAMEKESPQDREAYLNEACADDPQLRRDVEALLAAHDRLPNASDADQISQPPAARVPSLDPQTFLPSGTIIGRYKLEPIGEGGYGTVFMAEQTAPVQRKVALKIIKAGMDTRQVIARFEAERQALALMDHSNIAKVFDAGVTDTGRPYFVMELVKGVPITKYCDEHHIEPRQRLELFMQVCQAVQHAHQKGIIHRDLKPSNVLVAQYDGKPVPKVIDFGVAKATGQQLTERTMFTGFGDVIGTLEYMSPEQAEVNQLDVDTRSDIYSLGVLLYELLTGSTPLEHTRVMKAGLVEMLRVIREEEPPKPSTRLSTAEGLPGIAANRGLEPKKLSGLVHGELDWIVMKALEKDRARRYETANGLAMDLQRFLRDETVQACPPSARYRLRKFARRYRVAIATATLVAATLVLGTIVSTWQAVRAVKARTAEAEQRSVAERERREAEKQRGLAEANFQKARKAVDEYFTLISESKLLEVPGMQPLRKELLEAALRYYQTMLDERADDPAVLADLAVTHLRVAKVYHEVDRNDDALSAIDSALQLVERLRRDYPGSVEHQRRLAGYWTAYRPIIPRTRMPTDSTAARRTVARFLQVWEQLARENPSVEAFQSDVASINYLCAGIESGYAPEPAAFARAIAFCDKSAAIWERLSQAQPEVTAHRENLARVYSDQSWWYGRMGQWDKARQAGDRETAVRDKLIAEFPNVPAYRSVAARKLRRAATELARLRPQEAEEAYRQAIQAWQKLAEDFPIAQEYTLELAAREYLFAAFLAGPLKRPGDALQIAREEAEHYKKLVVESPGNPTYERELARSLTQLGNLLRKAGREEDAVVELRKAHVLWSPVIDQARKAAEAEPKDVNRWQELLVLYFNAGEWENCLWAVKQKGQALTARGWGFSGWEGFHSAMSHWHLGRRDEAYRQFYTSLDWMDESRELRLRGVQAEAAALLELPDPTERAEQAWQLNQEGLRLDQQGLHEQANEANAKAIGIYESLATDFPMVPAYNKKLVELLTRTGRQQELEVVRRRATTKDTKDLPTTKPEVKEVK